MRHLQAFLSIQANDLHALDRLGGLFIYRRDDEVGQWMPLEVGGALKQLALVVGDRCRLAGLRAFRSDETLGMTAFL
jgi:hypothetical protein